MISLLLVDDQPMVRAGLRMRLSLQPGLEIVGEAADGLDALDQAERLQPDVVVMDVEMPGMDGVSACRSLRERGARCGVVVLTLYDNPSMRTRAQAAGAQGFVGKHEGTETLLQVIQQVGERKWGCPDGAAPLH